MSQDNGMISYDSVCKLIGRLILDHEYQIEQLGKSLTQVQERYNSCTEEVQRLRSELMRTKQELSNAQGTHN